MLRICWKKSTLPETITINSDHAEQQREKNPIKLYSEKLYYVQSGRNNFRSPCVPTLINLILIVIHLNARVEFD